MIKFVEQSDGKSKDEEKFNDDINSFALDMGLNLKKSIKREYYLTPYVFWQHLDNNFFLAFLATEDSVKEQIFQECVKTAKSSDISPQNIINILKKESKSLSMTDFKDIFLYFVSQKKEFTDILEEFKNLLSNRIKIDADFDTIFDKASDAIKLRKNESIIDEYSKRMANACDQIAECSKDKDVKLKFKKFQKSFAVKTKFGYFPIVSVIFILIVVFVLILLFIYKKKLQKLKSSNSAEDSIKIF